MKHILLFRPIVFLLTLALLLPVKAQGEQVTKNDVSISFDILDDGTINVLNVWNKSQQKISLSIDGVKVLTITANSSVQVKQHAKETVRFDYARNSGSILWSHEKTRIREEKKYESTEQYSALTDGNNVSESHPVGEIGDENRVQDTDRGHNRHNTGTASMNYLELMNQDEFFGLEAVETYINKTGNLSNALINAADKQQFIIDHDLEVFLSDSAEELENKRTEIPLLAQQIVSASKVSTTSNKEIVLKYVIETLNNRLRNREDAYEQLKNLVADIYETEKPERLLKTELINIAVIGGIAAIILLWLILSIRKKKTRKTEKRKEAEAKLQEESNPAIVVRRRTTSILKKQCLDNVIDNPAYLLVETKDFMQDSAVRRIYIKNSCIKEVYNLYAEDLRNESNPKEDGCMVLGRWVHDEASDTYDISMETVVLPGDDAIFKEYELNFGGKIKLRTTEKLRKLRRDTNLQYDLTCWIHSHPKLGIFFSNSDSNVQIQLKHSQHPNFLVAFVIDILTPDQDLGIFTFKKDGSISSKGDLNKLYSLEKMYKWALESEKESFNPNNFYSVLENAKVKTSSCYGIEMNNNAIIDLTQIIIEEESGLSGWVTGYMTETENGREYIISGISKAGEKPSSGIQGCLLNIPHISQPTIQRLISSEKANINFVLVYSMKLMSLTSIPVVGGGIVTDENFYGTVNIDDLKIWTRRRR